MPLESKLHSVVDIPCSHKNFSDKIALNVNADEAAVLGET